MGHAASNPLRDELTPTAVAGPKLSDDGLPLGLLNYYGNDILESPEPAEGSVLGQTLTDRRCHAEIPTDASWKPQPPRQRHRTEPIQEEQPLLSGFVGID